MKTKTYNVYKFHELTEEGKEKAIDNLRNINVDYDWFDYIDEDGNIKLLQFDLYRGECDIEFGNSALETAQFIKENHGEMCDTYKTTIDYLEKRDALVKVYEDKNKLGFVDEGKEYEFDEECDDLDDDYQKALASDYLSILRQDEEYRMSNEAIIETIEANDYDFTEDGKID